MKLLTITTLLSFFYLHASTDPKKDSTILAKPKVEKIKKNKKLQMNNDITVIIRGMVCSFCAQGIEKTFKKDKSIEAVKVNLKEKSVKIKLKKGETISDLQIISVIKNAGYNIKEIKRYEKKNK